MTCICKEVLGWDKQVSGTWARHSFATNLKLAGVEELYVSESMGHSQGNRITPCAQRGDHQGYVKSET